MTNLCAIYLTDASVTDHTGCQLPEGHQGAHEFTTSTGHTYNWYTDLECGCEHCRRCEGDYCTVYWNKANVLNGPLVGKRLT